MLTLFLALLLLSGLAAAFVWIPRLIDRRTESFQSDLVNRHYEEVENMYRTMRAWRHDYHNHIQAAGSYLELGKYEELAVYLKELDESLYEIDQLIKTGNLMADLKQQAVPDAGVSDPDRGDSPCAGTDADHGYGTVCTPGKPAGQRH